MDGPPSFNLADRPWLPYVATDGTPGTASLRWLLINAHEVRDLVVDTSTQYPAILRFLLAVLHRSLGMRDNKQGPSGPREKAEWTALHQAERFPSQPIEEYLDTWRDRFDLFSEKDPFLQVAGLSSNKGTRKSTSLLIPYAASGNNAPIFSAERDATPISLTPAEAARWLIHVHAWDTAGIKTGAEEDPRAKDGKTTGNRIGPLGSLGVLVPTGSRSLWETLMLNLLVLDDDLSPDHDTPVWERAPLGPSWEERPPRGLLDVYTWPSRRVRLFPDTTNGEVRVRGVLVCAGDRMSDLNVLHAFEPHTKWHRAKPGKESGAKQKTSSTPAPAYRPRTHPPHQQLWRGLGGILGYSAGQPDSVGTAPKALLRLGSFRSALRSRVVLVRAYGIAYGNQNAVIDESYTDTLPLPVALLDVGRMLRPLRDMAVQTVEATEKAAWALGVLAADVTFASGGSEEAQQTRRRAAQERLYAALDQPFREWIQTVQEAEKADTYREAWYATARKAARAIADDVIAGAPPSARRTRFRSVKKGAAGPEGRREPVNVAIAEREFQRRLEYSL